jgi:hypothetical protein
MLALAHSAVKTLGDRVPPRSRVLTPRQQAADRQWQKGREKRWKQMRKERREAAEAVAGNIRQPPAAKGNHS